MSKLKYYEYNDGGLEKKLQEDIQNAIEILTPKSTLIEKITVQKSPSQDSAFSLFKEIFEKEASRTTENFMKFTKAIDEEYSAKGWTNPEKRIERDMLKFQLASFIALQPGAILTNKSVMDVMNKIRNTIFLDLTKRMSTEKEFTWKINQIKSSMPEMEAEFIERRSTFGKIQDSLFGFKKLISKIYQAIKDIFLKSQKVAPPPIPDPALIPMPAYPAPSVPNGLKPDNTPKQDKILNGQIRGN